MSDPKSNSASDAEILRHKENYDELWVVVLMKSYGPLYSMILKKQFNGKLNKDDIFQKFATKQVSRTQEAKRKGTKIDGYKPGRGNLCNYYGAILINVAKDWIRERDGRNKRLKKESLSPEELSNEIESSYNPRTTGDPVESAVNNEVEMAFWDILDKYPFREYEKDVLIADWIAGGRENSQELEEQYRLPKCRIYNIRCKARKKLRGYFKKEGYNI